MLNPSPLERLLSSRARAALVRWVVEEGTPTSVGDLGRQLGFTPAGLRREVPGLVSLGVLRVVRHGNADVLEAGPDARLNEALGAPLAVEPAKRPRAAEKVLVDAVALAREDATVLRTLPVVFERLGSHLDWTRLRNAARASGVGAELGMVASLTAGLTGRPELAAEVDELQDRRRTRVRLFHSGRHSRRERTLAERRTPEAVRRWGFLMNMDEDAFRSILERRARP